MDLQLGEGTPVWRVHWRTSGNLYFKILRKILPGADYITVPVKVAIKAYYPEFEVIYELFR
jgi:hypothetical protein